MPFPTALTLAEWDKKQKAVPEEWPYVSQKVWIQDYKELPGALEVHINDECHTMGNLLATALREDQAVKYAGYRLHHPLEARCHVQVEVINPEETSPQQVVHTAFHNLETLLQSLETQCYVALGALEG